MPTKEPSEAYSNYIVRSSVPPSRFVSGAYLLYNLRFSMRMIIGMAKCRVPFSGNFDLAL